jgi:hypothetical protein
METKTLIVDTNSYLFTYSEDTRLWANLESDFADEYQLDTEISMKNFPEGAFHWEDVAAFISYLKHGRHWLSEQIEAAKQPLFELCRTFFKDAIDEETDSHMDLDAVSIEYRGCRQNAAGGKIFSYDILYSLYDTRDPYSGDLGMFIWRASFDNQDIRGVQFDL